eukprot:3080682-Pleurochrysis_carterae.AAC.1
MRARIASAQGRGDGTRLCGHRTRGGYESLLFTNGGGFRASDSVHCERVHPQMHFKLGECRCTHTGRQRSGLSGARGKALLLILVSVCRPARVCCGRECARP